MKRLKITPMALVVLQLIFSLGVKAQNGKPQVGAKANNGQTVNATVNGGGTPGRVSRWTGSFGTTTYILADSNIFEDKFGKIGIGPWRRPRRLPCTG